MKDLENKLPYNIQFFAEPGAEPELTPEPTATPEPTPEQELSAEERLQQLMVENAKLKKSVDKTSSEAATYKKQLREKLSADEIASQEKAEKEAERQEKFASMERKIAITDLTNNFMDLGYPKDNAIKAATAQNDGDIETLLKIQKEFQDTLVKQREAEWLKNRPTPQTGTGEDGMKDLFIAGFNS